MTKCTQQTRWKIILLFVFIFTSPDPLIRAQSSDRITSTVVAWGRDHYGQTADIDGLKDALVVAGGLNFSLAVRNDGTVTATSRNLLGPIIVPDGLTGVTSIAAGFEHSLALKSDGTVIAWGPLEDDGSSLGLILSLDYGQATVPDELGDVVAIAAGGYHSLALKGDGTVVAWGAGFGPVNFGQSTVPEGVSDVVAIAAGRSHSLALKADGTLFGWGRNDAGQIEVNDLREIVAITAGMNHSLGLKRDGTVIAWGDNEMAQSSVPPGLSDVAAIAAGAHHSLALQRDGTVVSWGADSYGQSTVPAALGGVVSIAAGGYHNLALVAEARSGLEIRIAGDDLLVSWPSWATNHTLEVSEALSSEGSWRTESSVPVIVDSHYVLTSELSGGNRFYRLRQE